MPKARAHAIPFWLDDPDWVPDTWTRSELLRLRGYDEATVKGHGRSRSEHHGVAH